MAFYSLIMLMEQKIKFPTSGHLLDIIFLSSLFYNVSKSHFSMLRL